MTTPLQFQLIFVNWENSTSTFDWKWQYYGNITTSSRLCSLKWPGVFFVYIDYFLLFPFPYLNFSPCIVFFHFPLIFCIIYTYPWKRYVLFFGSAQHSLCRVTSIVICVKEFTMVLIIPIQKGQNVHRSKVIDKRKGLLVIKTCKRQEQTNYIKTFSG